MKLQSHILQSLNVKNRMQLTIQYDGKYIAKFENEKNNSNRIDRGW
jgi:hypothetical protein